MNQPDAVNNAPAGGATAFLDETAAATRRLTRPGTLGGASGGFAVDTYRISS